MSSRSIFYDNWRDCLRAHYVHVLQTEDVANEVSLRTVLLDTGFEDHELNMIRNHVLGLAQIEAQLPEVEAPAESLLAESHSDNAPVDSVAESAVVDPSLVAAPEPAAAPTSENVSLPESTLKTTKVENKPLKKNFYQPSLF